MAKITKKGLERIEYCNANELCTVCLRPLAISRCKPRRGAHVHCLNVMTQAFRTGEQDEAKVVAAGVLHESKTRGRKKLTIAAMPKGNR